MRQSGKRERRRSFWCWAGVRVGRLDVAICGVSFFDLFAGVMLVGRGTIVVCYAAPGEDLEQAEV